jgi:hypothetical protein
METAIKEVKKLNFLIDEMGMERKILLEYRQVGMEIPRIRKTYPVINDINDEMVSLIGRFTYISEPFEIINNEYIRINKGTRKIGKWIKKRLSEDNFQIFASQYSQLLSKAKQTGKLIISNKLTDMLCASNLTHGWNSCQSFDYGADCRAVANLIYYLSPNTYIAIVENEFGFKTFRQWIHKVNILSDSGDRALSGAIGTGTFPVVISAGGAVLFGRPYPDKNFLLENYIRQVFMEDILKVPSHWQKVIPGEKVIFENYNLDNTDNVPYSDIKYRENVVAFPKTFLFPNLESINQNNILIEVKLGELTANTILKCLWCGQHLHGIESFCGAGDCGCFTNERDDYTCCYCGDGVRDEDVYWGHDDAYCMSCFNQFYTVCENCHEYVLIDDSYTGVDGCSYCEDCWSSIFGVCDCCKDVEYLSSMLPYKDSFYCSACYDDLLEECQDCGENFEKTNINENGLCIECAEKQNQKKEKENATS